MIHARKAATETIVFAKRLKQVQAYDKYPALLKIAELEALHELGNTSNAQLHITMPSNPEPKRRFRWNPYRRG